MVITIDNELMNTKELHEHRKERLRALIEKEYGGVQKNFAEAVGIDANYISRILSDSNAREHRNIGNSLLARISKLHPHWLDTNVEAYQQGIFYSKPIRISGEIQGGDGGYLSIQQYPEGFATGCIMLPVSNPNCYALKVRGDSMHPRIKHGEIIAVDPDHPPEPGDDVVVNLKDGRQMVKVYLYKKHGEVTLGSINNNHVDITISQDQIEDMHYVIARLPGGAVCKADTGTT
ncbi:S24 family peptidase [Nitrosomonas communis]|uniref:S24 family peptidase n=1 Tax=Nitrosomonas communis TaxID=44574 RepID=UPI003D299E92